MSKQWSGIVGLAIAFLYGSCSASMAFANKAVLTSYSFNYPFFLVTCQMAISIVVLELLRLTGRTSLVPFTFARGWMFLVPSVFYAANCVFALSALGGMNIPMYGLIKRCIPVAILGLSVFVLRKPLPSMPICLSVSTITLGCIIAGMTYPNDCILYSPLSHYVVLRTIHAFLQRAQLHCKRCISYGNSVRLSVCPSICLTPVLCQNDGT